MAEVEVIRQCVYRGFCPDMDGCGYCKTEAYRKELEAYRSAKPE